MDGGVKKNIWIIANWKSNKNITEALDWVAKVGPQLPKNENLKIVICPTFSALSEVKKAVTVGNFPMMVGSQDLSPFGTGAYTGEESAELLKDLVDLSILGHSERKKNFNETDEMVAKKVEQAINNKIIPLVCVQDEETPVPQGCNMIAYEPIWAISTGLTNTPGVGRVDNPEDAAKVAGVFKQKYGQELAVIYGGSVDSSNVKGFIIQENIAGVLVGNASLDAEEFIKIVKIYEEI
ncbi:triosephosphate isomerase [Candidatus Daviesbacteria bacterium]|nr:triosephosphate isomerase [Candidatus Daviesbacteria bacterium]